MKFVVFDLETTSTNTETCEVVQAAVVKMPWCSPPTDYSTGLSWSEEVAHTSLFHAAKIPLGATQVHGISAEHVADAQPFARFARGLVDRTLLADDSIVVTFNGALYDLPIVLRANLYGGTESERRDAERRLRERHVDVWRLWERYRQTDKRAACYAGSLAGAHLFWCGDAFDGAHDATVDCRATLRVLEAMLCSPDPADVYGAHGEPFVDLPTAIRWSSESMPGDVDFAGKFSWVGDTVIINFGEHNGKALEDVPPSYLRWMVDKATFPRDTTELVRAYLRGEYPVRRYEDES